MKRNLLRVSYVIVAIGLAVSCIAAVRPDLFQILWASAPVADGGQESEADTVDAIAQFSLEREQLRSMQLTQLDEIIHSEESSQQLIDSAQNMKIELLRRLEMEQTISGILRARGYRDATAAVSDDTVNILIRTPMITEADTVVILELVLSETDVATGDIKIIPIN